MRFEYHFVDGATLQIEFATLYIEFLFWCCFGWFRMSIIWYKLWCMMIQCWLNDFIHNIEAAWGILLILLEEWAALA